MDRRRVRPRSLSGVLCSLPGHLTHRVSPPWADTTGRGSAVGLEGCPLEFVATLGLSHSSPLLTTCSCSALQSPRARQVNAWSDRSPTRSHPHLIHYPAVPRVCGAPIPLCGCRGLSPAAPAMSGFLLEGMSSHLLVEVLTRGKRAGRPCLPHGRGIQAETLGEQPVEGCLQGALQALPAQGGTGQRQAG